MRIIVATAKMPFVSGGAESQVADLEAALVAQGHEVETFVIPFNPTIQEKIPEQMLACRLLNLSAVSNTRVDRLIALKFPAYLIPHPDKVVWLLHQHRSAYDLWDDDAGGLHARPRGFVTREAIRRADRVLGSARKVFSNSKNVADRLRNFCEIDSSPLYHPPRGEDKFRCERQLDDHIFFPSRLHPTKRQSLALQALALTQQPVRMRFAGLPDDSEYDKHLQAMADKLQVGSRVEWMKYLSEAEKVDSYARTIAVLYPPLDEDYGYVTLEAMLSSKPVITCRDSGGPLEFVLPNKTGLITEPTPEGLAEALDDLWKNRSRAVEFGAEGRRHYAQLGLSWPQTVKRLLA